MSAQKKLQNDLLSGFYGQGVTDAVRNAQEKNAAASRDRQQAHDNRRKKSK